jgi:hypothetical protein
MKYLDAKCRPADTIDAKDADIVANAAAGTPGRRGVLY